MKKLLLIALLIVGCVFGHGKKIEGDAIGLSLDICQYCNNSHFFTPNSYMSLYYNDNQDNYNIDYSIMLNKDYKYMTMWGIGLFSLSTIFDQMYNLSKFHTYWGARFYSNFPYILNGDIRMIFGFAPTFGIDIFLNNNINIGIEFRHYFDLPKYVYRETINSSHLFIRYYK